MSEQYDAAFLGVLQNEGNIGGFLDAVLGFLYRRTDFYKLLTSPQDKMGFPPGTALKILVSAYKKFEDLAKQDEEYRQKERSKSAVKEITTTPPVLNTVEVTTEPIQNKDQSEGSEYPAASGKNETVSQSSQKNVSTTDTAEGEDKSKSGQSDKVDDDNPELARLQRVFQSNPESYNGAMRDNYTWSQSITDVDVHVKVPKYIMKGKDVKVSIEKKHLSISHKSDRGSWEEVMNEDLTWEVNKEESMWSLVPSQHVHVNLEKKQERWWEGLLVSEPKISVRKIDASRPMSDLDDEAQSKIEEMMYNERQKKLGLPTSEEKKMHNILKDAWDAEGSPFKGQPFDPSKLSMNQGGVVTVNPDDGTM